MTKWIEQEAENFADLEHTKRYAHTIYAGIIDGYSAGATAMLDKVMEILKNSDENDCMGCDDECGLNKGRQNLRQELKKALEEL